MADHDYDAIVIGSGLGGLTTAAYLATNGLSTLVLEQYNVVGGSSHVFRRKRQWEFDVGVHYLGDCGEDGVIPTVFRGLGLDGKIEYLPMDPDGFSTYIFPGLTFRVPKGWDRYLERLIETFPKERDGLERCVQTMRRIAREVTSGSPMGGPLEMARFALRSRSVIRWNRRTLADLFDRCGLSPEARAVISGECGDYALPPSRASVLVHSILMDHYLRDGAFYPKGGGMVFAAHLADVIRSHGGKVRTQAQVKKIEVINGKVTGVRLADGEEIRSPLVVSNADIKKTMLEMVGPEHLRARTLRRMRRYTMGIPIFSVYLGLDIDLRESMPNTNYFIQESVDIEQAYNYCSNGELPQDLPCFITSASVKDPYTEAIAPPGCSSLEIMTVVPPDYRFWGVTQGPARGERYSRYPAYRAIKERIADELIESAGSAIPGIKDRILWQEASTPLTHERYTLATGGTSYGIEHTPRQTGLGRPRPKTEIDGLYLAGASTIFAHGIAGVIFGGIGTASAILQRDLISEVQAGKVFGDPSKLTAGGPGWDPLEACRHMANKPRSKLISEARKTDLASV